DAPRTREDGEDDQALDEKSRPPREDGRDEASQQRPDRGGDRARRADQRKDPRALLADEVAVDQRLHRREVERGAETADDGPEDDDRGQALREDHRARADQKNSRPVTKARLRPKRSPSLLLIRMKAADTSDSIATADCTPLTVVSRSRTTAEIETFMNDVSMTKTNIAAARKIPSRGSALS